MRIQSARIENHDLNLLSKFIERNIPINYYNKSEKLSVYCTEKFVLRNDSSQANIIVLKQINNDIVCDIIAAGGGTSIFNFSLFSESGSIKKTFNLIKSYCADNNVNIVDLGFTKEFVADEGI